MMTQICPKDDFLVEKDDSTQFLVKTGLVEPLLISLSFLSFFLLFFLIALYFIQQIFFISHNTQSER